MRPISPALRDFASRLLALEAASEEAARIDASAAFRVCQKLRTAIVTLVGVAGFQLLLSRALALASGEVGWLDSIHVKADGSLEGFDEIGRQLSAEEIVHGQTVVVARLIGLLVIFIGAALTVRVIQGVWPEISSRDLVSETENDDG